MRVTDPKRVMGKRRLLRPRCLFEGNAPSDLCCERRQIRAKNDGMSAMYDGMYDGMYAGDGVWAEDQAGR